MKKFIITTLLFASCSDKYQSIRNAAPDPELRFTKEVLTLREKDSTNINLSGKGKFAIHVANANHEMNLQFASSNSGVHFVYRGTEIKTGQSLVLMDSINLFCYTDTAGVYSVDFYVTDQLGKTSQKQLIINSLSNKAPAATFFDVFVEHGSQDWHYYFDASISHDPDGVIRAYHYSIDGQWILTSQPVMHWNFHSKGIHDIGLYVTDDLGKDSEIIHKAVVVQ